MSSLKSLSHQVNKLAEQVGPPEPEPFNFAMDLFTAEERERLQRFLAPIIPGARRARARGHLALGALTDSERSEFGRWAHLDDALRRGDLAEAAKYRSDLSTS